jgi:hypothetical protein
MSGLFQGLCFTMRPSRKSPGFAAAGIGVKQ